MRIETLAVHAGHEVDQTTGAVSVPIHLSTTFEREADGGYRSGFSYSRSDNPNRRALEQAMAALEGGAAAAAFGSGLAATAAVFQALAPGDHVIAPDEGYHGALKLLRDVFVRWGVEVAFVDMTGTDAVRAALRSNTKLVWTETPSNPQLKITDLASVARIAKEAGALCACDNTWAPIVQKPLTLGLDLVVHSTTKYIGGHCDVTGGVVIAREDGEFFQRVRANQNLVGGVPSPFDCWLTLRGFRTLPWRMRAHSENALKVATFLSEHPRVERVNYPGLASNSGHELAARQMSAFSGMLSFEVRGGREAAVAAAAKTRLFIRATSLGGVESLIEHRASITGESPLTPQGLLRVSIGLEHPDDLIDDLLQALG
ncbi:MAG: aminotransferase class V-fold PLP-dependent enzyme [Gemmatimonadaceae bacterium]|nr:aminotransferase class V-fold PLP-dependent enzyme [Gemmatimonadaceae bacterium]MBA3763080.1 aminotransferase class V-fold PLP-dependent enzyme [Chthoniobacterales bacterium]